MLNYLGVAGRSCVTSINTNLLPSLRHHVGWFPFRQRRAQPFPDNVPPQAAVNQDQNNNLQVWCFLKQEHGMQQRFYCLLIIQVVKILNFSREASSVSE